VEVPANGTTTTVIVPPLLPAPPESVAKTAGTPGAEGGASSVAVPQRTNSASDQGSSWNGKKTAAVILGGVGVAAGVFSVVKIVDYRDRWTAPTAFVTPLAESR